MWINSWEKLKCQFVRIAGKCLKRRMEKKGQSSALHVGLKLKE